MRAQVLFLGVLLSAGFARAHDPGLSTTQVEVQAASVVVTVGFAPNDVRMLLPVDQRPGHTAWTDADFAAVQEHLRALAPSLVELKGLQGALPWTDVAVTFATTNSVLFRLSTPRPAAGRLTERSLVMDRLPPGHRDYLTVGDGQGNTILDRLLAANDGPAAFDLPPGPASSAGLAVPAATPPNFWEFLKLGIGHIWTGYDHLLFLFGLLVVCRSFRSIVGIISCFTVAHSITLALATLNVVNLPSRIVEPMIAASICFVGIENLIRRGAEPKGRWALTFAFGLIHGFGFASVLRELGVGSNGHGLAVPLFTFNLGVEIGQITIAAIVLPAVWQLRKNPTFLKRGVPVLSAIVAAAGLYWLLERTLF